MKYGPRQSPTDYSEPVLTQLVTKPIRAAVALIELPLTARRSLEEVTELMEISRRQLEAMQRQTDTALNQAERMNDLLARVVRLTEPLERAQRGGEYVVGGLKQMIFGEEASGEHDLARAQEAAKLAEAAAEDAETVAEEAEAATDQPEDAAGDAAGEGGTIRVIPNRPSPRGDEPER